MTITDHIDIEVRRVGGALGAEVHGVDLRTIDDATFARVRGLLLDHLVLFFPNNTCRPTSTVRSHCGSASPRSTRSDVAG